MKVSLSHFDEGVHGSVSIVEARCLAFETHERLSRTAGILHRTT